MLVKLTPGGKNWQLIYPNCTQSFIVQLQSVNDEGKSLKIATSSGGPIPKKTKKGKPFYSSNGDLI
jgi:hypothetical protein